MEVLRKKRQEVQDDFMLLAWISERKELPLAEFHVKMVRRKLGTDSGGRGVS